MIRVKKLKTIKAAKHYYARQQKKTAAAKAQPKHDSVTVSGLGEIPLIPATHSKPSRKPAEKPRKAVAATLGANDKLPESVVTRVWQAGKSLTEIAHKIGTGTRPNGTGYRIGRIRAVLAKAGLYPRKREEVMRGFLGCVCFSCVSRLQRWG